MRRSTARAGYFSAGLAVVLTVAGAAAVQAQGSGTTGGATIAAAKSAVAQHSARFGFGPGQTLQVKVAYRDANSSTIRFNRSYRGLAVLNGDFIVHLDKAGNYRYAEGMRLSGLPSSIQPAVSRDSAIAAAKSTMPYASAAASTKLVVFGTTHGSPLAWQVATRDKSGIHGDVTYVSATAGKVLASWPTVLNHNGTGKTLYSGQVALKDRKVNNHKFKLIDNSRGHQVIWDAHNAEITSGTIFTGPDSLWGTGSNSSRETAGADAAYGLANTWDYYLNTYGRSGIADDGVAANAYVHVYNNYANASWDDSCFCMRFGDGNGSTWGPLVSLDVGGHEMTHGVTSRTAGLIYANESGGLNESTSDVMGTEVEWYANNANDVPDYMIGEEFYTTYDPENNYLRRMDKPSLDGASKDCWYSGIGNLDPHYSSGVGNHLFYLLSEGSGAKIINGLHYDSPTCNSSTVTGIGHKDAAAIWYQALTHHWTANTTYHDARTGMLTSATELFGAGSAQYNATNAAWAAVNVS